MRHPLLLLTFAAFIAIHAPAMTMYVNVNNPNPVPPYTNWPGSATIIANFTAR